MTGGDGFVLGVDFGTSNTVAMLRRPDGRVTPLLFDGTPVLPSAVFAAPDRVLFVGRDALHHGRHRPAGLEPNPKQRIDEGSVLLSGLECAVPDLIGAVLGRVADEATRVAGHRPGTLVLSHPAGWGPVRRLTLTDAAAAVGLPTPVFVPEPVAAAMYFTSVLRGSVPSGAAMLVYDLGAGTFDVTVLRAGTSFEVLGSDGLDDVGGLDVDGAVVTWLRDQYTDEAWDRLSRPRSPEDRRLRQDLWAEARVAKEMLSRTSAVVMRPPLLDQEVPLTLAEFEQITQPLIDRTVRTAQGLSRYCEVTPAQVLLVGGSSRIPLVATALHRAFGVPPTVTEQPETVVAEGCVFAPGVPPAATRSPDDDRDPVALSTVLPVAAGLSTEPFTADVGPGALPAAPLGRSVLPAMPGGTAPAVPTPAAPAATSSAIPAGAPASVPAGAPASAPVAALDGAAVSSAAPSGAAIASAAPAAGSSAASAVATSPTVATLPASALRPGAIPGARAGDPSTGTGLLWPPLPPAIAVHPLAAGVESTADTARLLPASHGTPRNAGPARQLQRNPGHHAGNASALGADGWPDLTPLTGRPAVTPPVVDDEDAVTEEVSPDWSAPPRPAPPAEPVPMTRMLRVPVQPAGPPDILAPVEQAPPVQTRPLESQPPPAQSPPAQPPPAQPPPAQPPPAQPPPAQRPAVGDDRAFPPGPPAPPRRAHPDDVAPTRAPQPRRARAAVALLAVVFLLAAAAVTLIVTVPTGRDRNAARPSAGPPFPTWAVRYADSLGTQRGWSATADVAEKVECGFRNGRLEVDMRKGGIFRCPGQRDELTDFALRLDVYLLDGQACAGIWFRRGLHEAGKDSSYVLEVCRTELVLGHHHAAGDIAEFARFPVPELGTGIRTVVGLVVRGGDISLYLHDGFVGRHDDGRFPGGRMALGIAVPRDLGAGRVGFSSVELRTP
ncbi:hypothetical protein GCM10009557_14630 [Virgisporangium ochraceum]